ncbi:MAG: efflux RND transporter periplasmic adaptor subunit [Alphaproteobacteria bacterium]|nr:efflux RND transporter periplasmic adaptor subunit [Alphaproteobacteria bacterium]
MLDVKNYSFVLAATAFVLPALLSTAICAQTAAPTGQPERIVPVLIGEAKLGSLPMRIDTIGTVQPVASVTLRPRVEGQIIDVAFADGAVVHAGDVLVRLDQRSIEAQIRQAEATVARTTAQLEQAQRDVVRNEALAANEFASKVNLENSKTQVATFSAQLAADRAALDSLKVQLSYYTISAPISGRVGVAGNRVGNIAKTGDGSVPFAIINQISPIYVAFSVPQRFLPDIKTALNDPLAKVEATFQGSNLVSIGKIAVVDNAIDTSSGTVTIRAIFDNANETLWPGSLCNVRVTLKIPDNVVSAPREAVQSGPKGSLVFVVTDGRAKVTPVKVGRTVDGQTEIIEGLSGNEKLVTDGQIQLVDGVKVEPKGAFTGAQ